LRFRALWVGDQDLLRARLVPSDVDNLGSIGRPIRMNLIAGRAEDDVVATAIGLDEGQAERRPLEYDPFLAVADGRGF
jgi:hypothetical protein